MRRSTDKILARTSRPEDLVRRFRDAVEAADHENAQIFLVQILGNHTATGTGSGGWCEAAVQKAIRTHAIPTEDIPDFRSNCYERIMHALLAPRPGKPLWEKRFGVALFGAITEVIRKWIRERKRARRMVAINDDQVRELVAADSTPSLSDHLRHSLVEILEDLDPPVRRAAYLYWGHGFKIESIDREETTIATVLGVSGRTVRSYLAIARSHIASYAAQHAPSPSAGDK